MKLTPSQVRALATELRQIASGLDDVADAVDDSARGFNYPDHSMTVQLFKTVFD